MKLTLRTAFVPICIAVLIALLLGQTARVSLAAGQETKRVFVLNSFNRGYTWTDNMLRGIDEAFGASGLNVETYVTFMDMKRIPPTPQYFSQLKALIQEGYQGVRFDAVLACDNDALEFLRQYRDELFPGVPVVFVSVNDFDAGMLDGRNDITGTSENTDYQGTLELALKLRPATKNIVVVVDATTTGQAHRSAVEKIRSRFPASLTFTYLSLADMTLNELAQKLSQLSSDSSVLLLQHFVDKDGTSYTVQESTPLLTASSAVPVFVVTDIRLGLGALGGHVVSGYLHGYTAAQMVVRILSGTAIQSIPVLLDSPNQYLFDYRVLQRFNIAENNLPPGSILLNKPVSVFDVYRNEIVAVIGVFLVLCGFLAYLLLEIRRRRRIEAALRESEANYRSVFEQAAEGIFIADAQGQYLDVNPSGCQMLGYTRDEILRLHMRDLLASDDPARAPLRLPELQRGETMASERHMQCKDGRQLTVEISGKQLPDGRVLGIVHDLSARRQAEEALRQNQQMLVQVLNTVPQSIFWKDRASVYLGCNAVFARAVGLSAPEAIVGRTDFDLPWPRAEAEAYRVDDQAVMETAAPKQHIVEPLQQVDGTRLWVDTTKTPLTDPEGRVFGLLGVYTDVTERRHAEAALRESEARYRRLFENAVLGIFQSTLSGQVITVNAAFARMFGYASPEEVQTTVKDIGGDIFADPGRRAEVDRLRAADPTRTSFENLYRRKDGSTFTGQLNMQPVLDAVGQVVGFEGLIEDISARKQAEQLVQAQQEELLAQNEELQTQGQALLKVEAELRRLNADLEQRVADRTDELRLTNAALVRAARAKDEFLASMSHELRTPLTGILGLSEALHLEVYGVLTERQLKAVDAMHTSGEHLLDLINDILDVAKLGAGKVELQPGPVKVAEVCQASVQVIQQLAQQKKLRLGTNLDLAVDVIRADARRLKQMLVNLLSNAVKFTPEGGSVSLEVTGDPAQNVVRFTVADTGIGIAPEDLPRLFKAFVQLDSRLSRNYAGTGLGLALVMGMAELHGGGVQVESAGVPGQGSRFTVSLPWTPGLQLPETAAESEPSLALRAHQALVVEDTPEAAEQLARYLTELGIASVVHPGGEGAAAHAATLQSDVILLDLLLPDVPGWQVLAELKANPRTRAIPVVVVSVVDDRPQAERLGAAGYLVKPVARTDLQHALDLVRARGAQAAPAADGTGPRVLVVDDSQLVLDAVGDFLAANGFQVEVAREGGEALDLARAHRPAVILMDIQMPGMDGLEAIRRLRAEPDPALAATPIIALTALVMPGDRERCLTAGANDYLSKPVALHELTRKLAQFIVAQA